MRNTHDTEIELTLIRHGKTKGNLEKRYIGVTDEPLLEEEKNRLEKIAYEVPELLFVSSRKRAKETAKILFPGVEMVSLPELDEMNFGDFEGKNYLDLKDNEVYQQYIDSNGRTAFPGGESMEDFANRIEGAFNRVMAQALEDAAKKVTVVAHGGTIMAILWKKLGGDYFSYYIGNGECLRVQVRFAEGKETWNIIS